MGPLVIAGLLFIAVGLGSLFLTKQKSQGTMAEKGASIYSGLIMPIILIGLGCVLLWTAVTS